MGNSLTKEQLDLLNTTMSSIIGSTLNSNTNVNSAATSNTQNIEIDIGPTGKVNCRKADGSGSFRIGQKISVNENITADFSNDTSTEIKNSITADLNNDSSQIMKVTREMLSSIGASNDDETLMNIKNIIENNVNNYVNTSNLNKAANSIINVQNNKLVIEGVLEGDSCDIFQETGVEFVQKTVAKNIINNILNSSELATLVSKTQQDITKKEGGLAQALAAAALLAVAVGIMYYLKASGEAKLPAGVINSTSHKISSALKSIAILGVAIGIYLLAAKLRQFWPFEVKPQYWGCSKDSSDEGCKEYSSRGDGPFDSKDACESSQTCKPFYNCEFDVNGYPIGTTCKRYQRKIDAPPNSFQSLEQCNTELRQNNICRQYWYCAGGKDKKCLEISKPVDKDGKFKKPNYPLYGSKDECSAVCKS